jgi:hypothetical protein
MCLWAFTCCTICSSSSIITLETFAAFVMALFCEYQENGWLERSAISKWWDLKLLCARWGAYSNSNWASMFRFNQGWNNRLDSEAFEETDLIYIILIFNSNSRKNVYQTEQRNMKALCRFKFVRQGRFDWDFKGCTTLISLSVQVKCW